jgi:hypothetical protein
MTRCAFCGVSLDVEQHYSSCRRPINKFNTNIGVETSAPADELGKAKNAAEVMEEYVYLEVKIPRVLDDALRELSTRLQRPLDMMVQRSVEQYLRERGITWWETRLAKVIRTAVVPDGK